MKILIDNLFMILGIACFSVIWSQFEIVQIPIKRLSKLNSRIANFCYKVLTCNKCIALWTSILVFYNLDLNWIDLIFISCITSILSQILYKKASPAFNN